ncbi:signal recognition particle-docking protein FtsY [Vallitalea guaymasensis]|uniref:Signal recognition particle receptor FtsY n=1 Tax=Vallitalea guaymasensis TaxID=1185412 RepID=A0A8J8M6Q1_9FIRM|nr:signal recognition particle-docking protein FtsY [Vallitalea guaymasensis]
MGLFSWKKNKTKEEQKENTSENEQELVDAKESEIEGTEIEEDVIKEDNNINVQENNSNENDDITSEEVIEDNDDEEEEENQIPQEQEEGKKKRGFFGKLVKGLTKTRNNILGGVDQVLSSFTKIDEDFYEELEEALIVADLGVNTAMTIIEDLREKVKENKIKDTAGVRELLMEELKELMKNEENLYEFTEKKSVVLVIGVNGVGKTTTIGKLANQYKQKGKKVILAAADTFRAAAIDQLAEWSNRAGVELISQQENSDPGAVVFDAVQAAKAREADLLICDTAGRLHNKKNLMEELRKIFKIINREYPEAHKEVLLVLDSTTGQNALQQAKQFKDIADITGIVLTKLDGTAKGGIAVAIQTELNIPVKYIGVGEGIDDMQQFNSEDFVSALFEE